MPAPEYDALLDLLAPADALVAHLNDEAAMDDRGCPWMAAIAKVVDRQEDMETAMAKAVAKASGLGIFVSLDGWDAVQPTSGNAFLPLVHSVSLWSKPEQNKGGLPEAVALGALARLVHAWTPPGSRGSQYRWRIGACAFVKAKGYRVFEFPATYEVVL